jgi:hypothetical protein
MRKAQDEIVLLEKEEKEELHRLQLIEQFNDFASRMISTLSSLSFEQKRQIVRLLVDQVIVDKKREEITVRHILPLQKSSHCVRGAVSPILANVYGRLFGRKGNVLRMTNDTPSWWEFVS